jgi:hypothetical protein
VPGIPACVRVSLCRCVVGYAAAARLQQHAALRPPVESAGRKMAVGGSNAVGLVSKPMAVASIPFGQGHPQIINHAAGFC